MASRLRRRLGTQGAFAIGAIATGLGLFVIGSSLGAGPPALVGRNMPIDSSATDPTVLTSNNSPALAQSPTDRRTLAVANRIDKSGYSCDLHLSHDAGATWAKVAIPFPEGEEAPPRCFAPDVAFGPKGTMYLSFVTLEGPGNTPHAAWLVTSPDGGRTMSRPAKTLGPLAFQVGIAPDPTRAGRLYLTRLQAKDVGLFLFPDPGNPILVSRSDDDGGSWSEPVAVAPPSRQRAVAPTTKVGPDGTIYVLYLDVGNDRLDYHGGHAGRGGDPYSGTWTLVLARSGDNGESWAETVVDPEVVPTDRFVVFTPPTPSLAVDPGGDHVYAAFMDGRAGDPDVWLWASADGGKTFLSGRRVNDTRRGDNTAQYLPAVAVAPNGRVDVVYYDRRADKDDNLNETSLQSSSNHGASFGAHVKLSDRPFDSRESAVAFRGMRDLGSRLAIVSADNRALAMWTDTRGARLGSGKQDLASAIVAFPKEPLLRRPLRLLGLTILVAGLIGLALALRRG